MEEVGWRLFFHCSSFYHQRPASCQPALRTPKRRRGAERDCRRCKASLRSPAAFFFLFCSRGQPAIYFSRVPTCKAGNERKNGEANNEDAMDTAHQQASRRQHDFAATITVLSCTRSHRSLVFEYSVSDWHKPNETNSNCWLLDPGIFVCQRCSLLRSISRC